MAIKDGSLLSVAPPADEVKDGDRAADDTRRLAQALLPRCHEFAVEITARVIEAVPTIAPVGEGSVETVMESTEQNIGAVLSMLAFGVVPRAIELPPGTRGVLRQTVAAGGDVTTILRAYRLGHSWVSDLWSHEVTTTLEPSAAKDVLVHSSKQIFAYFDRACERVVDEYRREFSGPLVRGSQGASQHAVITRLLGGEPADLDASSVTLNYELRGHHMAVVVCGLDGSPDARGTLDALARAAGSSLLAEPAGPDLWWGWLGWHGQPDADVIARICATDTRGALVGLGEPGVGRSGFRRSHEQARDAERTARLAGPPVPGVVRHRDVEVAGLLCVDPDRAQRLVSARLGALATRDETCCRLRETLRVFLACGRNKTLTAEKLHVHHKTVAYRVTQAEAMLGRSVSHDALDIEVALIIDGALQGR